MRGMSKVICQEIKEAVPGSNPNAHQMRRCASSIAFLISFDLTQVQSQGQWTSASSFVNRYFPFNIPNVPCMAMTSLL